MSRSQTKSPNCLNGFNWISNLMITDLTSLTKAWEDLNYNWRTIWSELPLTSVSSPTSGFNLTNHCTVVIFTYTCLLNISNGVHKDKRLDSSLYCPAPPSVPAKHGWIWMLSEQWPPAFHSDWQSTECRRSLILYVACTPQLKHSPILIIRAN